MVKVKALQNLISDKLATNKKRRALKTSDSLKINLKTILRNFYNLFKECVVG